MSPICFHIKSDISLALGLVWNRPFEITIGFHQAAAYCRDVLSVALITPAKLFFAFMAKILQFAEKSLLEVTDQTYQSDALSILRIFKIKR